MKSYIILLFITSLVMLNTSAIAQGISVSPMRIFFNGSPGQIVSEQITLSNSSQKVVQFISSLKDWDRDSTGNKRYFDVATLENTNATWLSLDQTSIHLDPGETKKVNLFMKIPYFESSKKLTSSMLFFTQVNEQTVSSHQSGLNINVLLEVGLQIYHIPAGLEKGDIELVAFEDKGIMSSAENSNRIVRVKLRNTGEINKDAFLRFELTNMETGEEIPIKSTAFAMLPHAEQWITITLPSSLQGRYLAVAIVDAGNQYDLKVAEKEIQY